MVTESGSGIGLADITVNLYQDFDGWSIIYAQLTAGGGTYEFSGLPAGTYRIEFVDESGNHLSEFYNNVSNLDLASDIYVTDGNMETGKDAVLTKVPVPPEIQGFRRKTGNTWEIIFTCAEESSYILQNKYAITNKWNDLGAPTNCVMGTNRLGITESALKCYWRLQWVP